MIRTLSLEPHVFAFEEPNPDLTFIPLAARRALDAVGQHLSLEAWQSLSLDDRRRLIAAGAPATVDHDAALAVLSGANPEPQIVPIAGDPAGVTPELLTELPDRATELESKWQTLTPLERYALAKLASGVRGKEARRVRLAGAASALIDHRRDPEGASLVSPANSTPAEPLFTRPSPVRLSHLTEAGDVFMVDVGAKQATERRASARATLRTNAVTLNALLSGSAKKGDALATARIAGIQAAKRTPDLIPLCHAVALTGVEVEISPDPDQNLIEIRTTAHAADRTGVEMEALVAASVAALTLYDMLKSSDREMSITRIELVEKSGGRSGDFRRSED